MFLQKRLKDHESTLKFNGQLWHVKERKNDPYSILGALCSTAKNGVAGGTHTGILGEDWTNIDHAIVHIAHKAEEMDRKNAFHELHDFGGAKFAIICDRKLHRHERMQAFMLLGDIVDELSENFGKRILIGADVGTKSYDLLFTKMVAPKHVSGIPHEYGGVGDTGTYTGRALAIAMKTAWQTLFPDGLSLPNHITVNGVGSVGIAFLEELFSWYYANGIRQISIADIRQTHAQTVARRFQISMSHTIAPDTAWQTTADVLVPCAIHPIVNNTTVEHIGTRLIVSGQNALMTDDHLALRLHERGIWCLPPFVTNGMGIVMIVNEGRCAYVEDPDAIFDAEIPNFITRIRNVVIEASDRNVSPYRVVYEKIGIPF